MTEPPDRLRLPSPGSPVLRAQGLSFSYSGRETPTLCGIDLEVYAGQLVLLTGSTGSGKSTLLKCLAGIIPHLSAGTLTGEVQVDGLDIRSTPPGRLARHLGMVLQNPDAQLCATRVEDEIAFGLENLRVPRQEMDGRIAWALERVGLLARRYDEVRSLSGGQKQRLVIGAALAMGPRILLLDEPISQLDPAGARDILALLGRLREQEGLAAVLIEHRLEEAAPLADRVVVMDGGRIVLDAPAAEAWRCLELFRRQGLLVPALPALFEALGRAERPLEVGEAVMWLGGDLSRDLGGDLSPDPSPLRGGASPSSTSDVGVGRPGMGRTSAAAEGWPVGEVSYDGVAGRERDGAKRPGLSFPPPRSGEGGQGGDLSRDLGRDLSPDPSPLRGGASPSSTSDVGVGRPGMGRTSAAAEGWPVGEVSYDGVAGGERDGAKRPGLSFPPPRTGEGGQGGEVRGQGREALGQGGEVRGQGRGGRGQGGEVPVGCKKEARPPLLTVEDLHFRYHRRGLEVLRGIDLTVRPGERIAILGANGSGKSTLLGCLAGVHQGFRGRIRLDGRPLRKPHLEVGMVFQDPDLMLLMDTVYDEVAFAPLHRGLDGAAIAARAAEAMGLLRLEALAEEPPLGLSRGQRLRVAVASVLSARPRVLLLDEPTTGQDRLHVETLMAGLTGHARLEAVLFCTHDVGTALRHATRVLVMAAGRIVADGAPETVLADAAVLEQGGLVVPPARALAVALGLPVFSLEALQEALRERAV